MSDGNHDDSPGPDQPHPVQIVSFEDDPAHGGSKVAFHTDRFQTILSKCGSITPVIISIIGTAQSGKSSFLNYAIRYLTRRTSRSLDDLNSWTESPAIEGFYHGKQNRTSGIGMWSEPYFMENVIGEGLAILLMDTQGLALSSRQETMWVFDICCLLSTVIIFNQDGGKLSEDHFLTFMEHFNRGSPIIAQVPFFVIRDYISSPSTSLFGKQDLKTVVSNQFGLALIPPSPRASGSGYSNSPKLSNYMRRLQTAMKEISEEPSLCKCWFFHPLPTQTKRFESTAESLHKHFREVISECVNYANWPRPYLGSGIFDSKSTSKDLLFMLEDYARIFANEFDPPRSVIQTKMEAIGTHIYIATVKLEVKRRLQEEAQNSSYGFLSPSSINDSKSKYEHLYFYWGPKRVRKMCPTLDAQKIHDGLELVYQEALLENEALAMNFSKDFVMTGYLQKIEEGMTELVKLTREALEKTPQPTADELYQMHVKFVEEFVIQFTGGASVVPQARKIMMARIWQITPLISTTTNIIPLPANPVGIANSAQDAQNYSVSTAATSKPNRGSKRPSDSWSSDSESSESESSEASSFGLRKKQTARKCISPCFRMKYVSTASITPKMVKRRPWDCHTCTPSCLPPYDENDPEMRTINPLLIPICYGFKRKFENEELGEDIFYRAPCGRELHGYAELQQYLKLTGYKMGIDYFCFDDAVDCDIIYHPTSDVRVLSDMSNGQEKVPIQCCNAVDNEHPDLVNYTKERQFHSDVFINPDEDFLVCCDCEDDCADKEKCGCWKLTMEGYKKAGEEISFEVGYQNRRLMELCVTGIYECNSRCKCKKTCLNRVVQLGLKWHLQVFKTTNKGWGVLSIHDIPAGAFICSYAGVIMTDQGANQQGGAFGDEYLAELDLIEACEKYKEGFEAEVVDPEPERSKPRRRPKRSTKFRKSAKVEKKPSKKPTVESKQMKPLRMFFGQDSCYVLDGKTSGNIGRYLNHSCRPNVFVQNVFVDSHDLRFPWVAFFALEYIPAGTELTWDYNYEIDSVAGKTITCKCGSLECRGRLL